MIEGLDRLNTPVTIGLRMREGDERREERILRRED